MKRLLFCLGTRPEAIKLAPLILAAENFLVDVLITNQHPELSKKALGFFNIVPNYFLPIESQNLTLDELKLKIVDESKSQFSKLRPDYIVVQGDTLSSYACALAASEQKIPIIHVEAGIRSHNLLSPFPEEGYRMEISKMAQVHFAATESNAKNLFNEKICDDVFVVGNTCIDALRMALLKCEPVEDVSKNILITIHRRENLEDNLNLFLKHLKIKANENRDANFYFPVHPNPRIIEAIRRQISESDNIKLLAPLNYLEFIKLMQKSHFIITDSGGLQEETSYLNIPLILLRDHCDRTEENSHPHFFKVGTDMEKFNRSFDFLMKLPRIADRTINLHCPYGNGEASKKIIQKLHSL